MRRGRRLQCCGGQQPSLYIILFVNFGNVRQEEPLAVAVSIRHQRLYDVLGALDLRSRSAWARKSHGEIHLDVEHPPAKEPRKIRPPQNPRTRLLSLIHPYLALPFGQRTHCPLPSTKIYVKYHVHIAGNIFNQNALLLAGTLTLSTFSTLPGPATL